MAAGNRQRVERHGGIEAHQHRTGGGGAEWAYADRRMVAAIDQER